MTDITADKVQGGEQEKRARAEAQQAAELAALAAAEYQAPAESAGPAGQGQDQGDQENAEMAGTVALVLFELIAARAGDHWRLSPAEAKTWGDAAGPVLDKYLGRVSAGPEFVLIAATLGLVVPRVLVSRAVRRDPGDPEKGDRGDPEKGDRRDQGDTGDQGDPGFIARVLERAGME